MTIPNVRARSLARTGSLLVLDDTLITAPILSRTESRALTAIMQEWTSHSKFPATLKPARSIEEGAEAMMLLHNMSMLYREHVEVQAPSIPAHRIGNPQWFRIAPARLKAHMRHYALFLEAYGDIEGFMGEFPYTGLAYAVRKRGLAWDIISVLHLHRLSDIHQLGYLHDHLSDGLEDPGIGSRFIHNRLTHSIHAYVLARLVAHRLRLSEKQTLTLGAAALTHDATTPAGGDTTKLIDPIAFDEERTIEELLQGPQWELLCGRYKLATHDIIQTIRGQGLFGELLDIVDKIAYVAEDTRQFLGQCNEDPGHHFSNDYALIAKIVQVYPLVCSVWECVEVVDGHAVFTSMERLERFLYLRTFMSIGLYYHPHARWWETVFAKVIISYLYHRGTLTARRLRSMRDDDLDRVIEAFVDRPHATTTIATLGVPRIETFDSRDHALTRERELIASGIPFTLVDSFEKGINTATALRVRDRNGRAVPLKDLSPTFDQGLDHLVCTRIPKHRLYYLPEIDIDPKALEALRRFRSEE